MISAPSDNSRSNFKPNPNPQARFGATTTCKLDIHVCRTKQYHARSTDMQHWSPGHKAHAIQRLEATASQVLLLSRTFLKRSPTFVANNLSLIVSRFRCTHTMATMLQLFHLDVPTTEVNLVGSDLSVINIARNPLRRIFQACVFLPPLDYTPCLLR